MPRLKDVYESLRTLIVWLGVVELVWIAYWLLRTGDAAGGYTAAVVTWIVAMVLWLAFVIRAGRGGASSGIREASPISSVSF